ncbi:DNA-3-methyladenine glycosylase [Pedobacter cryophilus]|uniref:Putative 3-methyladenine DNA glycosylase n=1 Tax=Pedobacter cryophilus TaxID=2571271 RepID=A0A4U1BUH6_9SPHI|nr:DNA-3-methyladenine glycosylase [Pedobacter cryophilus]TKB95892.1 DNA-3-methyladenine glycosylase [Pedobacter cryophilus]
MKLPKSFYLREDTLLIAKELIGKFVFTKIDGNLTGGMIVETEAYIGPFDAGSHAFNNRKTPKNATMFEAGGVAYLYICYGIHDMLNVVTGEAGSSHAILIRAFEPMVGIETMQQRRGNVPLKRLAKGPGSLAKALGLNKSFDKERLTGDLIWIEDQGLIITPENIKATGRVGLSCAEPYFSIPWRFCLSGNAFVSKG